MVVMNEAVVIMMMAGLWMFGLTIAYQRFFVIRKLRRKVDELQDARPIALPQVALAPVADAGEFEKMKKRLEVLERITVEKENSIGREIDALRVG